MISGIIGFAKALGNTSIHVYEWKEPNVRKARLPNAPDFNQLAKKRPDLQFSGWQLAHAVVKADYLDQRNTTMPGLGFLCQASGLIDCSASPIELQVGAATSLNDVSLTSFAGRVGQGMAILYAQHHLGLTFATHLRSHVEALPAGSPGKKYQGHAMADFLFADDSKTVLVEAKASCTLQQNNPVAIKGVLKGGLEKQIDPWMGYLNPPPANGYVVYSCLRECRWAPSALSVVDPDGEEGDSDNLPLDREQVMRENYAAWLRTMGLFQAAERLRLPAVVAEGLGGRPVETEFLVFEREGRNFATHAAWHDMLQPGVRQRPVVGIDLSALEAISAVVSTPGQALMDNLVALRLKEDAWQEAGSIFPDGSFLGLAGDAPMHVHSVRI